MIITSCHKDWKSNNYRTVSISGNRGKDANYDGECYPSLAPKYDFWKIWHDNIGKISEEENNMYYVKEYYEQVLSKLDPKKVLKDLDNSVLLCYENHNEFCHRHVAAIWLELTTGVDTIEAKSKDNKIEMMERPIYIREYLEIAMNHNESKVLKMSNNCKKKNK